MYRKLDNDAWEFDNLSKIDIKHSENLENLMPWSDKIPKNMKIKDKK